MNLMLGFEETLGLEQLALLPLVPKVLGWGFAEGARMMPGDSILP